MWSVADMESELVSARQLLQARPGHEPLMHGLGSALNGKLEAMIVGPSQLVQLYDLVKGSGLPDAMKNPMLHILDEKSMGKASGPCKVTAVPQQVDWINHYLTAGEHEKLGQCSPYEGAHVVCKRLRLMRVKSLKESSKKVVTALLISCELARGGARPSHESIYLLSQHVGHCFLTCATAAPPGAAALQCYPADPFQLPEAHLQASYGTDKPVAKAYPEMANLVQYHVPVRSTSAKVRGAKVEAQQNQATKKQEGQKLQGSQEVQVQRVRNTELMPSSCFFGRACVRAQGQPCAGMPSIPQHESGLGASTSF